MVLNKKILLAMMFGILLISCASATLESLKTAKLNQDYTIFQTCASCTYVNITVSNVDGIILNNIEMSDNGSGIWVYNFTPTSLGRYDVTGQGDKNSVDTSFVTYFEVTSTGNTKNSFWDNSIFVSLSILAFVFLIVGITIKNPYLGFLSGILFVLSGLYSAIYGFGNFANMYTRGVGIVLIGIGTFITFASVFESFES